jgi:hypothetical protein
MRAIVSNLTMANTAEANFRKLVMLNCFMAVGRSGEVGTGGWGLIKFHPALKLYVQSWYEYKTSKVKPVPILPACVSWELDMYLIQGDAACTGQFNLGASDQPSSPDGTGKLLYPQLASVGSVATKISKMLQDLVPGSGSQFAAFEVPLLNELGYSSHGFRHGAIEEMEANGVGPGHVTDLSGHAQSSGSSGSSSSSAFESSYHKISVARVVIGECNVNINSPPLSI